MSEKKLFVVENDYGKYWDFSRNPGWWSTKVSYTTTTISKKRAEQVSDEHGGHVVTLVEDPEKVVLSEEQAKIIEVAHNSKRPASYIILKSNDEELLMNAYVNGYTVAKEKRYLLPMEGFGEHQGYSYMEDGIWYINTAPSQDYAVKHGYTVTKDEYDSAPNWVKILKPVEVTDDEK
ncbi:DUF1642 domain-containing protein [Lacticaseibacillus paracasei]|uniref:DUF1642 domain-containing protein n=1 Tax=Lacticaseibacillus paracasei TaxID=1597 RepID=UPI0021AFF0F3|nr:DUF1642 domain-containing protein [Lacticaseibacillus paracasei]UWY25655.1 DUF1642 domain-containing protein [Lacticaseibacillus paracasei]